MPIVRTVTGVSLSDDERTLSVTLSCGHVYTFTTTMYAREIYEDFKHGIGRRRVMCTPCTYEHEQTIKRRIL